MWRRGPCLLLLRAASVHARSSVDGAPPGKRPVCARLSLRLWKAACCRARFKGWALSLCLFLLRLSLLVTPPCVPTPHLSVSQELRSPCRRSRAAASRCAPRGRRAAAPHEELGQGGGVTVLLTFLSNVAAVAETLCLRERDEDEENRPGHLTRVS